MERKQEQKLSRWKRKQKKITDTEFVLLKIAVKLKSLQ